MSDFLAESETYWLILTLGIITYLTRSGGYLILARFNAIHPRVEAALQAVPAAVLSTLVVPPALTKGPLEAATLILATVLCLRLHPLVVMFASLGFLVAARQLTGM